jgi:DNA repair exonuclease SbcCD ATPase subunit
MKILKVEIQGFGTFSAPRSFSFRAGDLNVVYGGNESGKSTLMEAIYATLFGFEKKDVQEDFESWIPSGRFTGVVELGVPGGTVSFFRDFSSDEVVVSRSENGKSSELFRGEASPRSRGEERKVYADVLRELLGFSDGGLARKTSFVSQLDLETEFTPALRGLVSGAGSVDYHGAIELLKSKYAELTVENPWGASRRKDRAMEETANALIDKRRQLGESEALFRDSSKVSDEQSRLREEIGELRKKRDKHKHLSGKIGRLVELQNRVTDNRERYESEHKAKESLERARTTCETEEKQLEKDYPMFVSLNRDACSTVSSLLSKGASIEGELAEIGRKLGGDRDVLKLSSRPFPVWLIGAVPVLIFLVLLIIGILQDRSGIMTAVGTVISVLFAVALWLFSRGTRLRSTRARETLGEIEERSANLRQHLLSVSEEVLRLFPEEQRVAFNAHALSELSTRCDKFAEARTRVGQLKDRLLSHESPDTQEGHANAVKNLAVAKSQLEEFLKDEKELLSLKDEPEKATSMAAEAEREVKDADSKLSELDSRLRELEIEHAGLSASTIGSPEAYQEEIEWLDKKLSRLARRRDALRLGVDTLVQCVEEYQGESMDRISARISELFGLVTGGRYTAVTLSENENPLLKTSSRSDIDLEQISTGAQDQLYFCMRIAMLEELSSEKGLPLILDDPFVNFDDERLDRARQLLSDLVEQRDLQVIIFTHGERHLNWPAHFIRLSEG